MASAEPPRALGKVLGHKQVSATEIHAHLHDDPFKAAVGTGAKVARAINRGTARAMRQDEAARHLPTGSEGTSMFAHPYARRLDVHRE